MRTGHATAMGKPCFVKCRTKIGIHEVGEPKIQSATGRECGGWRQGGKSGNEDGKLMAQSGEEILDVWDLASR